LRGERVSKYQTCSKPFEARFELLSGYQDAKELKKTFTEFWSTHRILRNGIQDRQDTAPGSRIGD
jgi:protein involved in ribonucleotide reduction